MLRFTLEKQTCDKSAIYFSKRSSHASQYTMYICSLEQEVPLYLNCWFDPQKSKTANRTTRQKNSKQQPRKNKQVSHLKFHPLLVVLFNVFGVLEVVCGYTLLARLYRYKIFGENKTALNKRPKRP